MLPSIVSWNYVMYFIVIILLSEIEYGQFNCQFHKIDFHLVDCYQ